MKKRWILVTILFLTIGFASVTAVLTITGKVNINFDEEDYQVYFSDAYLDDVRHMEFIDDTRKEITFTTNDLTSVGDKSVLKYEVTNNSKQYDAEVSVKCTPSENEYYRVTNDLTEIINAQSRETGTITIELKKVVLEEKEETFKCDLTINATSREDIPEPLLCENEIGHTWDFDYTGGEQEFIPDCAGSYKLEVWGAQGGVFDDRQKSNGGLGGYAVGKVTLEVNQRLYINVGGQGESGKAVNPTIENPFIYTGGYNGGGDGVIAGNTLSNQWGGGGGGATHIALETGLLSKFESKQEKLLIVAGGGGGTGHGLTAERSAIGGSGGGLKGNDGQNVIAINGIYTRYIGTGGTQQEGGHDVEFLDKSESQGTFGQGGKGYKDPVSDYAYAAGAGGGGGYYGGGGSSRSHASGGGGSGYIGNDLLTEKSMYCYNCESNEEVKTKTITTESFSQEAQSNTAKQGNGYARITYLGKLNP